MVFDPSRGRPETEDRYFVGPWDGPEHGLGVGGESLHHRVMGGSWTYADGAR